MKYEISAICTMVEINTGKCDYTIKQIIPSDDKKDTPKFRDMFFSSEGEKPILEVGKTYKLTIE